jgi:hypothetical protein
MDLLYVFFKEGRRERGEREEEGGGGALASPLKQILVILALVIYKILEKSLVL